MSPPVPPTYVSVCGKPPAPTAALVARVIRHDGPAVPALSRAGLQAELRELRDAWQELTGRDQDLSDAALLHMSDAALRETLSWYRSDEAAGIARDWLA